MLIESIVDIDRTSITNHSVLETILPEALHMTTTSQTYALFVTAVAVTKSSTFRISASNSSAVTVLEWPGSISVFKCRNKQQR